MRRPAALLLAAAALVGCGGGDEARTDAAAPTVRVQELENVLDLRADFTADAGRARVILLLSPT